MDEQCLLPGGLESFAGCGEVLVPAFYLPWTSICNLEYDYVHCKYLGVDRLLYSSVLYLMIFHVLTLGSPDANMAWLWSEIKRHYKAFEVHAHFQYLNKISMFGGRRRRV